MLYSIVVVRYGEEVVPEVAIVGDHFLDRAVAIRERGMGVQVPFQNCHVLVISYPGASLPSRANAPFLGLSRCEPLGQTAPPIFVESCNLPKKGKPSPQLRGIAPLLWRLYYVWRPFSLGFH